MEPPVSLDAIDAIDGNPDILRGLGDPVQLQATFHKLRYMTDP